jgi:hypothetical protein
LPGVSAPDRRNADGAEIGAYVDQHIQLEACAEQFDCALKFLEIETASGRCVHTLADDLVVGEDEEILALAVCEQEFLFSNAGLESRLAEDGYIPWSDSTQKQGQQAHPLRSQITISLAQPRSNRFGFRHLLETL